MLSRAFGADPALRDAAELGLQRQRIRYGDYDEQTAARQYLTAVPQKYTWRQVAGALLHDIPRTLFARHWTYARNRSDQLVLSKDGIDTRPLGNWSEDLYAPKVFPMVGKSLMRRALRQWPIRLSARRVCEAAPQVTFVIPFRGRDRLPALRAVVESILAQEDVGVRCLIVEQSAERTAVDFPDEVDVLHLPHPSAPEPWRKSWAFNDGVKRAQTEFVVCHDADILVPAGYAKQIVRLAEAQHLDVLHLQRFLFCLSQADTEQVLAGGSFRNRVPERIRQNWQGGTLAIRRETFFKLGGYDEWFLNWGGEDNEFYDRCRTQKTGCSGFLPFVHLWHPEQPWKYSAERDANLREMKRLLEIPPEQRIRELGGVC